jgi:hypothetical protein
MLIKFTKHSKHPSRSFNYLTGKKDHRGEIRKRIDVIRGNFALDVKLANTLPFKNKYTSGVISFRNSDKPTKEEIQEVLDRFENFAFAGLEKDQFSYSAILHEEKDSCHIHLFIPRCDLKSKKSLNVAGPGWQTNFESWMDEINIEKGWASPNDPEYRRLISPGWEAHCKDKDTFKSIVHNFIVENIKNQKITDRKSMIFVLKKQGFKITRAGRDYISVEKTGFKARFRGAIYDKRWSASDITKGIEFINSKGQTSSEFHSEKNYKRIQGNREKRTKKISSYNRKRYKQVEKKIITKMDNNNIIRDSFSSDNNGGNELLSALNKYRNNHKKKDFERIKSNQKFQGNIDRGRQIVHNNKAKTYVLAKSRSRLGYVNNIATGVASMNMDLELDNFKKNINLVEYATNYGFEVIQNKTSENSIFMRKDDEKIIIKKDKDDHYVFFSADDNRGGSIIDFCQKYGNFKNLGFVRKELRGNRPRPDFSFRTMNGKMIKKPKKSSYFQDSADEFFRKTKMLEYKSNYLDSRFIDSKVYLSDRFACRIFTDAKNNIIFPSSQTTTSDFSGAEIKNTNFTGQIKGGQKGIWRSNIHQGDKCLVFCESAIDCLSYAQLKPSSDTIYMSFGGGMSDTQKDEITRILGAFSGEIVIATDNDKAGEKFFEFFKSVRSDVIRDRPVRKDWNDDLKDQCLNRINADNLREMR